jgi:hypothetical protein
MVGLVQASDNTRPSHVGEINVDIEQNFAYGSYIVCEWETLKNGETTK